MADAVGMEIAKGAPEPARALSQRRSGLRSKGDSEQDPSVPSRTGSMTFYGWAAPLAAGVENQVFAAVHALLKD